MNKYFSNRKDLNMDELECREFEQLAEELSNMDFSKNSNKNFVFNKTVKAIEENQGGFGVKSQRRFKPIFKKAASLALIIILGIFAMGTSFAQELVDKVVNYISIGHVTVFEDPMDNRGEIIAVPEELKGKIFDKRGNPIEEFVIGAPKAMYTENGEEIAYINTESYKIKTTAEAEEEQDNLVIKDAGKLNEYTCFEVILPQYLPIGYKFDRAEFFRDENGLVENTKYISLYFTNGETGEYVYMQQRFANEETAYEAGGKNIEKLNINGADAILYDDNIDWEYDGIIYALNGRGIVREELIKIAKSFK